MREYWLIRKIKILDYNSSRIIDRVTATGLKEAQKEFIIRNDFKKLLVKCDLIIVESKKFFS